MNKSDCENFWEDKAQSFFEGILFEILNEQEITDPLKKDLGKITQANCCDKMTQLYKELSK